MQVKNSVWGKLETVTEPHRRERLDLTKVSTQNESNNQDAFNKQACIHEKINCDFPGFLCTICHSTTRFAMQSFWNDIKWACVQIRCFSILPLKWINLHFFCVIQLMKANEVFGKKKKKGKDQNRTEPLRLVPPDLWWSTRLRT